MALKNVFACGGSWMVKGELISAGKFDEITALTKEAIGILLGFELSHVGLNEENVENAARDAALFECLFHMPVAEGQDSIFVGKREFEVMKIPGRGEKGHLAINTNNIGRALFHLEKQGVRPIPGTEQFKDGKLIFIYLDCQIAGFAVHLRLKG
jgi:2-dehydro-3-deoxyphosphogluconate aldolase/(4S)-4-hydroxy-2-oxoglutarate aldolase